MTCIGTDCRVYHQLFLVTRCEASSHVTGILGPSGHELCELMRRHVSTSFRNAVYHSDHFPLFYSTSACEVNSDSWVASSILVPRVQPSGRTMCACGETQ